MKISSNRRVLLISFRRGEEFEDESCRAHGGSTGHGVVVFVSDLTFVFLLHIGGVCGNVSVLAEVFDRKNVRILNLVEVLKINN